MLDVELGFVGDMLVLASAARAEIAARRLNAVGSGFEDTHELGARETPFNFSHFGLNFLANQYERNENDKFLNARHALATEGDIADVQRYFLSRN